MADLDATAEESNPAATPAAEPGATFAPVAEPEKTPPFDPRLTAPVVPGRAPGATPAAGETLQTGLGDTRILKPPAVLRQERIERHAEAGKPQRQDNPFLTTGPSPRQRTLEKIAGLRQLTAELYQAADSKIPALKVFLADLRNLQGGREEAAAEGLDLDALAAWLEALDQQLDSLAPRSA